MPETCPGAQQVSQNGGKCLRDTAASRAGCIAALPLERQQAPGQVPGRDAACAASTWKVCAPSSTLLHEQHPVHFLGTCLSYEQPDKHLGNSLAERWSVLHQRRTFATVP